MATKKTTYASIRSQFQNKVNSYKTLAAQTIGAASKNRPTPAQLSAFSKWVDKGACIQSVSNTQLSRWSGKTRNWTTGTAKSTLTSKWGKSVIKAIAPNKTGGFIVVTSATRKGKQFKFSS